MLKFLFSSIWLLFVQLTIAQHYPDLIPYRIKDKWGYSDSTGKLKIKPRFETAEFFRDKYAIVSIHKKFGLINKKGKLVIEPQYQNLVREYNYFWATVDGNKRIKIDEKNTMLDVNEEKLLNDLKQKFELKHKKKITRVFQMEEDIFVAGYDTSFVEPDELGYHHSVKEVTYTTYFLCKRNGDLLMGSGLISISKLCKGLYCFSRIEGTRILKINDGIMDSTLVVSQGEPGIYKLQSNGQWMVLDSATCSFLPCDASILKLNQFENGFFMAEVSSQNSIEKVLVDRKLNRVSKMYSNIGKYSDGMCVVNSNGKYGFINSVGAEIITPIYTRAFDFKEGLALVQWENDFFYINNKGEKVLDVPFTYNQSIQDSFRAGRVNIRDSDYFGFSNGLAVFEQNGKFGFINATGKIVVEAKYDMVEPYLNHFAHVYTKCDTAASMFNYFLLDTSGKVVHTFNYLASRESTLSYGVGHINSQFIAHKNFMAVYDKDGYHVFNKKGERMTTRKLNVVYRDGIEGGNLIRVSLSDVNQTGYIGVNGKSYFQD